MAAIDKRSTDASHRVAVFGLLARAFARPTPGRAAEIRDALTVLASRTQDARLVQYLRSAWQAWRSIDDRELTEDYARLFDSAVSLHETMYDGRSMAARAVVLADIEGLYQAFGFRHDDAELPDHIAAELSFLSLLLRKESYALANDLTAQAGLATHTASVFLKQHLGRWVDALEQQIRAIGTETPYYDLVVLLVVALGQECRRRRVRPKGIHADLKREFA